MVDYDSVRIALQSQEAIYAATGLASVVLGYVLGRRSSSKDKGLRLSQEETKRAEIALAQRKDENVLELKKLDYDNADAEHKRDLELRAQEQDQKLRRIDTRNSSRMQVADKIAGTKGILEKYLADLKATQNSPELINAKQAYRDQLVTELMEEYGEQKFDTDNDTGGEDDQTRIDNLVELRYPSETPSMEMPKELKELTKAITQFEE